MSVQSRGHGSAGTSVAAAEPPTGHNLRTVSDIIDNLSATDRGITYCCGADRTKVSHADFRGKCHDLASRWRSLGVQPGDRVALIVVDEQEFAAGYLSAIRAGVIPVPLYPPVNVLQLDGYLARLRRICELTEARVCMTSSMMSTLLASAELPCPVLEFPVLHEADPLDEPLPVANADDIAFLQFTGGSTGDPRGVVITHGALVRNVRAIIETIEIAPERDRTVSWLPLYHDMGLIGFLFTPLMAQFDAVLMPPLQFIRNPLAFLREMSTFGGTIASAPNFAYALMTRYADRAAQAGIDLSRWRYAGCGAEPIRPEVLRAFARAYSPLGLRADALAPGYGLAEATMVVTMPRPGTGLITTTTPDEQSKRGEKRMVERAAVGTPVSGVELRVVDETGADVEAGCEGEILVRSTSQGSGYYRDPEATAATWRDGWIHTGDLGFIRDEQLYVTGRIKDLVIVNGRKYQPHDIEDAAQTVPGVRPGNVAAFAVERTDGEGVQIVAELKPEIAADDALRSAISQSVQARIGVPVVGVAFLERDALPKTSSGKLRRRATAALFAEGDLKCI
jgi:fatty-acyl-CoA synthase